MIGILICLLSQLDTMDVMYNNQLQLLRNFPDQSETVVKDWVNAGEALLPYLIRTFNDPQTDMFIREKIALAFGGIKDRLTLPILYPGLKSGSAEFKANCCRAIAEMADPASFDFILPLLKDPNDAVRGEAIYALGKLGDPRATSYLIEALKDSVFINRARVIVAFGTIRDRAMIPYLAAYRTDPEPAIRTALAKSLGLFRDETALPVLEPMVTDADPIVRREAFIALTTTPGDKGVGFFRLSLADPDPQVRDAAVGAIKNYLPETGIPLIFEFQKDGNPAVREAARQAYELMRPAGTPGFERILTADYPIEMKRWALLGLVGNLGSQAAVDRLMQLFPDKFRNRLTKIVQGGYEPGMDRDEVYLALGKPARTRATGGGDEEWDYDDLQKVLIFKSGILIATEDLE